MVWELYLLPYRYFYFGRSLRSISIMYMVILIA